MWDNNLDVLESIIDSKVGRSTALKIPGMFFLVGLSSVLLLDLDLWSDSWF